jgi:hypothetical protein
MGSINMGKGIPKDECNQTSNGKIHPSEQSEKRK